MRYDVGARSLALGLLSRDALLRAMSRDRALTPRTLGARVGRHARTTLWHLRRLEGLGWVEQSRPTTGKQWTRWRLTTKGEEYVRRLPATSV